MLAGKRVVVTGLRTPRCIGFAVARECLGAGADVVVLARSRRLGLAPKSAARLPRGARVVEADVNDEPALGALARDRGAVHGIVHSIGGAPPDAIGGNFLAALVASALAACVASAFSLVRLVRGLLPALDRGASVVAMDFDASVAWPAYDWMGVAKATLESASRYLARDLGARGIRVNAVSAGPLRTISARGILDFDAVAHAWPGRAPLGWDLGDAMPVARPTAWLRSDYSRGITGDVIHGDGGFHAVGA